MLAAKSPFETADGEIRVMIRNFSWARVVVGTAIRRWQRLVIISEGLTRDGPKLVTRHYHGKKWGPSQVGSAPFFFNSDGLEQCHEYMPWQNGL